MFFSLLLVTLAVALLSSFIVVRIFGKPIEGILARIIADEISAAWLKYIKFAIYVVGVSGGIRIQQLERYVTAWRQDTEPLTLNAARWTLEIYRTAIETLQSIAWMLLVFFVFALIAYSGTSPHLVRFRGLQRPEAHSTVGDEIECGFHRWSSI